jgi:hypothetical protein
MENGSLFQKGKRSLIAGWLQTICSCVECELVAYIGSGVRVTCRSLLPVGLCSCVGPVGPLHQPGGSTGEPVRTLGRLNSFVHVEHAVRVAEMPAHQAHKAVLQVLSQIGCCCPVVCICMHGWCCNCRVSYCTVQYAAPKQLHGPCHCVSLPYIRPGCSSPSVAEGVVPCWAWSTVNAVVANHTQWVCLGCMCAAVLHKEQYWHVMLGYDPDKRLSSM